MQRRQVVEAHKEADAQKCQDELSICAALEGDF